MEPDDADKDRGHGTKRSSEESFQSPAKAAKVDEIKQELTSPRAKQLTLAASLQKSDRHARLKKSVARVQNVAQACWKSCQENAKLKKLSQKIIVLLSGWRARCIKIPQRSKNGSRDR